VAPASSSKSADGGTFKAIKLFAGAMLATTKAKHSVTVFPDTNVRLVVERTADGGYRIIIADEPPVTHKGKKHDVKRR
jgi:hypothetical protein